MIDKKKFSPFVYLQMQLRRQKRHEHQTFMTEQEQMEAN